MAQQVQGNGGGHSSQGSNSDLSSSVSSMNEEEQFIAGKYRKLEDLGVGGYSRVILACPKDNNDELVAIKVLLSEQMEQKDENTNQVTGYKWEITQSKVRQCRRETDLMAKIQHDNVVKLIEVIGQDKATFPQTGKDGKKYDATPCLCVVLEYCGKGELFDYLMYAGGLGSRVTRTYFHQFLNGLQAMHDAGYVHRDLKPENLLLDEQYNLKIADFGFATPFKDNKGKILLASTCGTRGYLAPELIKGEKYTNKVDYFAVGIIMFTTFAGFPPFQHAGRGDWWWDKMNKAWQYWQEASALNKPDEKAKKQERIAKGNQKMKLFWSAHERSCKFGDSFKHLMQYLLNPNPNLRYGIKECFEHPWLKGKKLNDKNLRKAMKKHSEKVDKERKKKIQEQLKTRGMKEVTGHLENGATRGLFDKKEVVDDLEETLTKQDKLAIARNTAILNKARFQILSDKKLKDICITVEVVAVSHGTKIAFTKNAGEFLISAGVTRNKNDKEFFPKSEKIEIKVKIVYEKNVLRSNTDDDDDDDEDFVISDSDEEADADDAKADDKDKDNKKKEDNNKQATNNDNDNDNDKSKDDSKKRFYVAFWRVNGSADGFQRVMANIFYDVRMSGLLDLDSIDASSSSSSSSSSANNDSGLHYKTPQIFNTLFESESDKHTHYAKNAESDELPDSAPIPKY